MFRLFVVSICYVIVSGQSIRTNISSSSQCQPSSCGTQASCSTNSDCQCLGLSTGSLGICAVSLLSCFSLTPCLNDNVTCTVPYTACVIIPRCNKPMCYPLALADPQVCPSRNSTTAASTNQTSTASSTESIRSTSTSSRTTAGGSTSAPTTTKSNTNLACLTWNQVPVIVAGNGTSGNGTTTLYYPWDLSIDTNLNLYINEFYNNRIIKFSSGNLVGKPLTSGVGSGLSQVYYPSGSWIDTSGNLYITDTVNRRVLKYSNIAVVSQSPPIVGEVVVSAGYGCGYSQLSTAWDVAVDSLGNIFISDYWCNRVTKWTAQAATGTLAAGIGNGTAGNGTNGLSNPLGIYVDQNSALYITDYNNGRIQKWSYGSSTGVTVAGGNGQLLCPMDVSVDSYGTIFVLTCLGFYRFNSGSTSGTPVISTYIFGYGFKLDSIGNVYIADSGNNVVKKYTVNSTSCINTKAMVVPQISTKAASAGHLNNLAIMEAVAAEVRRKQLDNKIAH